MRVLVPALACAVLAGRAPGQMERLDPLFESGAARVGDAVYPWRLLRPPVDAPDGRAPLVVFLHGAGERGDDNRRQLTWLPEVMTRPLQRERFPCYLLAVQCPKAERWVETAWDRPASEPLSAEPTPALRAVVAAMDEVLANEPVDPARVYLTGLSMGGYGAWDLAARMPERFAALLAVCGGGDERAAARLLGLPVAVYHGADDRVVPVARSRVMVAALRRLGADVVYDELEGVGHDAWKHAYGDGGALAWLFAQDQRQQRRGAFASYAVTPAPAAVRLGAGRFALGERARCVATEACAEAGLLFAAGVAGVLGRMVTVVADGARPGDVVFDVVPGQAAAVAVEVDALLRITVREPAALPRAAAVAVQALCTWPGASCPQGGFTVPNVSPGGRVAAAGEGARWAADQLAALVRLSWLHGADTVTGDGFDELGWLDSDAAALLRRDAARAGVALRGPQGEGRRAEWSVALGDGVDLGELLSQSCPAGTRWVVEGPGLDPAGQLEILAVAVPAVAERAARPEHPIHVGDLLSRVGHVLRGD